MHAATAAIHERNDRPRGTTETGERWRCVPDKRDEFGDGEAAMMRGMGERLLISAELRGATDPDRSGGCVPWRFIAGNEQAGLHTSWARDLRRADGDEAGDDGD